MQSAFPPPRHYTRRLGRVTEAKRHHVIQKFSIYLSPYASPSSSLQNTTYSARENSDVQSHQADLIKSLWLSAFRPLFELKVLEFEGVNSVRSDDLERRAPDLSFSSDGPQDCPTIRSLNFHQYFATSTRSKRSHHIPILFYSLISSPHPTGYQP